MDSCTPEQDSHVKWSQRIMNAKTLVDGLELDGRLL